MIVDLPLNYALTSGQDRIIPTEDDARLIVPSTLAPVVLALQPTKVDTAGVTQFQSVIDSVLVTRAPASAQLDTTVVTIQRGLWELELELSFNADFASTPAAPTAVSMVLSYQGALTILSNIFMHAGDATTLSRYRLLLSSSADIILRTPATAAGQNVSARLNVNAIRIL